MRTRITSESRTVQGTTSKSGLSVSVAGPQGPQGPAGIGDETARKYAARALSGHRVVRAVSEDLVDYADTYDAARGGNILGVTMGAADAGELVTIVSTGEIDGFVGLVAGRRLYCGSEGELVQTFDPNWTWLRVMGFALSPRAIFVQIGAAIMLAKESR